MKTYLKTLFKRYIRDPQRNKKGEFNYYGEQVYFPTNSLIFKIAMEEGGVYERDNLKLIQLFLKPGTTLFDVGANIGMMAVPILYSQPGLKVLSVEASPNSLAYLKKTHAAASFKDRWEIIDKAVADKPGVVDFHISKSANGALDGLRNTERTEIVDTIKVECTTLDTIWNEHQQPDLSFIKIDIEGADLLALRGAKECIDRCQPVILMEWNQINILPFGFTNADLLTFAKEINYEIFSLPDIKKITSVAELNLLIAISRKLFADPNRKKGLVFLKFSILTPSFNSEKHIRRAIESVLSQNYKNWEHIIIDGASTDGTVNILKSYPHLNWVSEKDKGQSDAMNRAFKRLTGDLIIYLNADDELKAEALTNYLDCFIKNPQFDMIVADLEINNNGVITINSPSVSLRQILNYWPCIFPLNPVSYAYKRDLQVKGRAVPG